MLFPNRSRLLLRSSIAFLSLGALVGYIPPAKAIDITFDYSLDDDNNFFGSDGSAQRMRLEEAAVYFEGFTDSLSSLSAQDYTIPDPSNMTNNVTVNTALGVDEIKVYVGGDSSLSSTARGGSLQFGGSVRGQTDAPGSDVEPVVGFIGFNTNEDWHFGADTTDLIGTTKVDFFSTAMHELAHVLGFGTSTAWDNLVDGLNFQGPESKIIYGGGDVPLEDPDHWSETLTSAVKGGSDSQETLMDPTLDAGERKFLTDLDYAGLDDIGWEVPSSVYSSASVPFEFSPSLGIFLIVGMFGTKKAWNIWKSKKTFNSQPAVK